MPYSGTAGYFRAATAGADCLAYVQRPAWAQPCRGNVVLLTLPLQQKITSFSFGDPEKRCNLGADQRRLLCTVRPGYGFPGLTAYTPQVATSATTLILVSATPDE